MKAHQWLFRQGDAADRLYVVRSGRLRISVETGTGTKAIREVGPGAVFGELALLTGSERSASVRAIRDTELLEVPAEDFEALLHEDPGFALAVARELARQLQRSGGLELPETGPTVISVIPLGRDLPVAQFWAELQRAFATWGDIAALDGSELGDGQAFDLCVDDLERRHPYVLLLGAADAGRDEWREFCLRQADRVLVLAGDEGSFGSAQHGDLQGCDLVFRNRDSAAEIDRWLHALKPRAHHVIADGSGFAGAVQRLRRRVAQRSLGVVFSGGGARGLAHIGVLQVLAGEGFEVDRFGGCSIGSFVGAMAALGWPAEQIRDVCHEELVRRSPFNDYTFPRVALIRSRKAAAMLSRVFGDTCLEELPRPMFAVSADLLTSSLVVHRRGPILDAVGASMSIPGLVPPLVRHGHLLVDGGVLNNLPVDLMAETGEGPVVAVDVIRRMGTAEDADSAPTLPSIVETLSRATVLGSVERAESNRALARVIVTPDVQEIALRDFSQLDKAIEAGRRAAEDALAAGGKEALAASMNGSAAPR